ncbi:MAG: hypothetical protein ACOYJB_08220 [Christensenellaceae bacterium]|jgi:hypothetical protein
MHFFVEIAPLNILGIILVILGAVFTFGAAKFAASKSESAIPKWKSAGLAMVIVGVLLILFG